MKKPIVQKKLDELILSKEIVVKEFGKSKVFMINQSNLQECNKEELEELNIIVNKKKLNYQEVNNENKKIQNSVKEISNELSNEGIELEIKNFSEKVLFFILKSINIKF